MSMKRVPFTLNKKPKDDFDEFDKMYNDIKGGKTVDSMPKKEEPPQKKGGLDKYGIKPYDDVEIGGGNPFKPSKPDFSSKTGKSKQSLNNQPESDPFEESMPENPVSKQMGPNLKARPFVKNSNPDPFEESNSKFEQTPSIPKGKANDQEDMRTSIYSKPQLFKNLTKTGPKNSDGDVRESMNQQSFQQASKPSNPFMGSKPDPKKADKYNFDDESFNNISIKNPKEEAEEKMRKTTSKPFEVPKLTEQKKIEMNEMNKKLEQEKEKKIEEMKKKEAANVSEAQKMKEIIKDPPKKPAPTREKTPPKKEVPKKKPADDSDSYGEEKFEEPEEEYENDFDDDGAESDEDKVPNLNNPPKQKTPEPESPKEEVKPVNSKPFSKPFTTVVPRRIDQKIESKPEPVKPVYKEEDPKPAKQEPVRGKPVQQQQQQLQQQKKQPEPEPEPYQDIVAQKKIIIDDTEEQDNDFSKGMKPLIDDEMKAIQKERCKYLREFLALDYETFDNLLDIAPIGEYEVYVNKINGGTIKNSNDQTNDENDTRETQTEDEFQREFTHQWPEDKNQSTFGNQFSGFKFMPEERAATTEINENTARLIEFVKGVYPIIDEMLTYQSKNIVSKDKITNFPMYTDELTIPAELSQIFDSLKITCAFDSGASTVFAAFAAVLSAQTTKLNLSIIIQFTNAVPTNIFLSLSEIRSLYISINFKHALIGGSKDGSIILWDLRDSGLIHSKTNHDILNVIRSKENGEKFIFRLPNYSTDYLGSEGHNSAIIKIKDVYSSRSIYEIISLDEFGKVIVWNLSELTKYELNQGLYDLGMHIDCKIKVIKTTEFLIDDFYFNDFRQSVLCNDFDLDKQAANIFVCTAKGIAKADKLGTPKPPRTFEDEDSEAITTCIAVSANEFFFAGYTDGAFRVYSKEFRNPVFSVAGFSKSAIVDVLIPKYYPITLRNPAKYLEQLMRPIVFDADGNIFFFELDKDIQPSHSENLIKQKAGGKKFKLLHKWFESNLDLHLVYSVENNLVHVNYNCSKVLDATHEPIMKKNNTVSAIFKLVY